MYSFFNCGKDNLPTIEAQIFQDIWGVMLKRHKKGKKNVETLLTVLVGFALLEKFHSRFFASCNQSWNCKSCMKKTKRQTKYLKGGIGWSKNAL